MAENKTPTNDDLVNRLRKAADDAVQKLGDVPGGKKILEAMNGLRDRVDDLAGRMKKIDELEKRVEALEKAQKPAPRGRTSSSSRSSSSKKKSS